VSGGPARPVHDALTTDLTTFFKILSASLKAERERLRAAGIRVPGEEKEAQFKKEQQEKRVQEARARVAQTARAAKHFPMIRPRFVLAGLAAVAIVLAVVLRPSDEASLPPEVFGVWSTTNPRYANRSFEITATNLVFKNGKKAADFTSHPIQTVHQQRDGEATVYTVDYDNDGKIYKFAFAYLPSPDNLIRLTNQPQMEWRKQ